MSANTMDAEVGLAKIAASVLRCLVFTARCYQIAIALATHVASSRQVMVIGKYARFEVGNYTR